VAEIPKEIEKVISEENLAKVFEYIKETTHGTITLVIQDGKVVQVEKLEKIRIK
jgi:hypothetical protein